MSCHRYGQYPFRSFLRSSPRHDPSSSISNTFFLPLENPFLSIPPFVIPFTAVKLTSMKRQPMLARPCWLSLRSSTSNFILTSSSVCLLFELAVRVLQISCRVHVFLCSFDICVWNTCNRRPIWNSTNVYKRRKLSVTDGNISVCRRVG